MKCVGMQYLEAIRRLKGTGFRPVRSVHLSFVPDDEIGGHDGAEKFVESEAFEKLNVGIVLDEGNNGISSYIFVDLEVIGRLIN